MNNSVNNAWQNKKENEAVRASVIRYCLYFIMIGFFSSVSQILTNLYLNKFELFRAANFDDILINLFVVQISIIILPLSIFGIFTEASNEIYLGQNVAKYMYDVKYKKNHKMFVFSYKEVIVICLLLSFIGYILMAKACLAAELAIVIFSTTITIRSLFSWINMRINKEELQDFIRENVQNDIIQAIIRRSGKGGALDFTISSMFPEIERWVVDGGNYELEEIQRFHENLYVSIEAFNTLINSGPYVNGTDRNQKSLYYEEIDGYFDELVADLLRKGDVYRALKLSCHIIDINSKHRKYMYYHLKHYYYNIFCKMFQKMDEIQIDLLGRDWLQNYFVNVLGNGNVARRQREYCQMLNLHSIKENDDFKEILKEGCEFVFNSLMAIWENEAVSKEYKVKFMNDFLRHSQDGFVENSMPHVIMKLLQTMDIELIDIVINTCINLDRFHEDRTDRDLKKQQMIILSYIYYLFSREGMTEIKIPDIRLYDYISGDYLMTLAAKNIWIYCEEIDDMLRKYSQPSRNSYTSYLKARNEFFLFGTIFSENIDFLSMEGSNLQKEIIRGFTAELFYAEELEKLKSRLTEYLRLFGCSHQYNDEKVSNILYGFIKLVLQHNTEKMHTVSRDFDYVKFQEKQKKDILDGILDDDLILKICTYDQTGNKSATDFVEVAYEYQFIPKFSDFLSKFIISNLQFRIAEKWYQHNNKEFSVLPKDKKEFMTELKRCFLNSDFQRCIKKCEITSLEIRFEKLSNSEVHKWIKTTSSGYWVTVCFFDGDWWNGTMEFKSYQEACEYIENTFYKIIYHLELHFDNISEFERK